MAKEAYPRLSGWRAWVHPPQAGKPALHANTNEERSHPATSSRRQEAAAPLAKHELNRKTSVSGGKG